MKTMLVIWISLWTYLFLSTSLPAICAAPVALVGVAFAYLLAIGNRTVAWEVDPTGIQRAVDGQPRERFAFASCERVVTRKVSDTFAGIEIRTRAGRSARILSGAGLGVEDIRVLHEGLAYHAGRAGVPVEGPADWIPRLREGTFGASGAGMDLRKHLPGMFVNHLGISLAISGGLLLFVKPDAAAFALVFAGVSLLAARILAWNFRRTR
jgi:hypothetical protein